MMNEMQEEEKLLREEVALELVREAAGETLEEDEGVETVGGNEESVDPWAGVNPALRQAIESLQAQTSDIGTIHQRLKQAESRVGGMERRFHEVARPVEKTAEKEAAKVVESTEAWKDANDYDPELAEAMKKAVLNEITGKTAEIESRMPNIDKLREELQGTFEARVESVRQEMAIEAVRAVHEDLDDIKASPQFLDWATKLPPEKVARLGSWKPIDAIKVLNEYKTFRDGKSSVKDIAAERERRLNSAAADNRKPGKTIKTKSEDDMTEAEYRAMLAKQIYKT